MPIYVYKCPYCDIEVEERRKMSQADEPLACPLCGDLLVRGITSFMVNTGRGTAVAPAETQPAAHAAGCPCCYPITKR